MAKKNTLQRGKRGRDAPATSGDAMASKARGKRETVEGDGELSVSEPYMRTRRPIVGLARDYPAGFKVPPHRHRRGQLVFASEGVMTVVTPGGRWVVPPTRAIWIPAGVEHSVEVSTRLRMRTVYFEPSVTEELPGECCVVGVSGLLRELMLAAVAAGKEYPADGRDARVMRLIVDEIRPMGGRAAVGGFGGALHLPMPEDERAAMVARRVMGEPGRAWSVDMAAATGSVSARTLRRVFLRETGMSFGQWCQQARLQTSLAMLARGKKMLSVAVACGYQSQSAFTYAFRRCFGVTPSAYFEER